ncbi:hypothetical protein QVD17_09674 [Tagetes erecta]|uniref:Uncharacterized protein n=1 Tax=Tagetes erecta TaxID=13708 RepID=A0AAD8L1W2_TARER|nr:hypothetical protein QVD17_09674 [Tagetes erecta]
MSTTNPVTDEELVLEFQRKKKKEDKAKEKELKKQKAAQKATKLKVLKLSILWVVKCSESVGETSGKEDANQILVLKNMSTTNPVTDEELVLELQRKKKIEDNAKEKELKKQKAAQKATKLKVVMEKKITRERKLTRHDEGRENSVRYWDMKNRNR